MRGVPLILSGTLSKGGSRRRERLHGELVGIAQSAEMKDQFFKNGAESITNASPTELNKLVASEIEKYKKVISAAGIKLQ